MKVLEQINTQFIVGIDIETVRIAETFEELSDDYKSAWEYKNKFEGEIPDYDKLSSLWGKNSALYAEFSKVCAVSLVYFGAENQLTCKEFYGTNEPELLKSLALTLNNMRAKDSRYRLIGHASKYFDYPFLSKRFIINDLEIPLTLDSTNLKPWEGSNLCTNDLWKVGGTGSGSSLQALCTCLGIPISKVDLVGDAVGKAYYNSELERIGRYCSLDTIATFNVIRKFKRESIYQFDDVNYITAYAENVVTVLEEKVEQPLLIALYNSNTFSADAQIKFKELLVNPTDEDKVNLKTILTAHYQTKGDKVAEKKRKELEISNFIDSL